MSALDQFQQDLITHLGNDATLTALVSSRIWHIHAKQADTLPYMTYQLVSGSEDLLHSGPSGMEEFRVQFDIVAGDPRTIGQVRDALKDVLNGINRTTTFGGGTTEIGFSSYDTEQDFFDEAPEYYRKTIDFIFRINP